MRIIPSVLVSLAILLGPGFLHLCAADDDGVALGILYDTSGSMKDPVPNSAGSTSPKYIIANHALLAVVDQIQKFSTNNAAGKPPQIEVGLFTFRGQGATPVVDLGPFDAAAISNWVNSFRKPEGGTPLGNSLRTVARSVLDSPQSHKHILIITDGMNTVGPDPASVMPAINRAAEKKQSAISVHFIAFDVNAKVFEGVKQQGASVAAAADERQLNSEIDFILQNQILLEKPSTK